MSAENEERTGLIPAEPPLTRTFFNQRKGERSDNDYVLTLELNAAGIPTNDQLYIKKFGRPIPEASKFLWREQASDVSTYVFGHLYDWEFRRMFDHWWCKGPGIDPDTAEKLHAQYRKDLSMVGAEAGDGPREAFKGFGVGEYRARTTESLKALALEIKRIFDENQRLLTQRAKDGKST